MRGREIERESYKKMANIEPSVAIGKKWFFGLMESHLAQSNGGYLNGCSKANWRSR